jgi:hypothetical protein
MTARTDDGNQSISKVPLQQQFQLIKLQVRRPSLVFSGEIWRIIT